jgi:hypothetical protein
MYAFLLRKFGSRAAYWLTLLWYVVLMVLVVLAFAVPEAEFRYGRI